jgi:hypothetical protein
MMIKPCSIIAVGLISASWLYAGTDVKTFYVSPQGNDAALGSLEQPVVGISRALALAAEARKSGAQDRIRIVLRGGRYELMQPLVIDQNGLWPLTIEAYPNEKPVLSGGVKLANNWTIETVDGREVWSQTLPEVAAGKWYFRQLWVNGQRATVPVIPKNGGFLQIKDLLIPEADRSKKDAWQYSARDAFCFNRGDFQKKWHAMEDVYVISSYSWYHGYHTIKEIDESSRTVRFHEETYSRPFLVAHPTHGRFIGEDFPGGHDPETFYEPACYRIYNVFEALSEPGEFYLDRKSGRLLYIPRPGEKPETAEVVAPRLKQLLVVKGAPGKWIEGIVVDGITFSHTEVSPEKHVGSGNNYQGKGPAVIRFDAVSWSVIQNCEFSHLGETALEMINGSRDIDVAGNEFFDLGCGAIDTYGAFGDKLDSAQITSGTTMRLRITDNRIRNGGRLFPGHAAVNLNKTRNSVVAFNEVSDFFFTGIHLGARWGRDFDFSIVDNQVLNNHVHHLGQGHWTGNDMAAVYVNGVGLGVEIAGNVLHDFNCTIYGASGVYLDGDASHFQVRNNLIYNSNYEGLHSKGFNNLAENNIVYNCKSAFGQPTAKKFEQPIAVLRHNLFAPSSPVVYISKFSDPVDFNFRSESNLIWSLQTGSDVLVARKGDFGLKYAGTMDFDVWRKRTGLDNGSMIAPITFGDHATHAGAINGNGSMIAPVVFEDPEKGSFRMDSATLERARAVGFVPFEIKAGPRSPDKRSTVPFKPDNEAVFSPAFKQHVELVLPEWEKASAEAELAKKDKELAKKKLEEENKARLNHVQ